MKLNFGSIGIDNFFEPDEDQKGHPPSIGPQVSFCGIRAIISAEDAKGISACRKCGLFHKQ